MSQNIPHVSHRANAVRLGDVCNLVNGDAYKEAMWSTEGAPIIRIQNLNNATKPFNRWAGPLNDRVVVQDGDVLLAWSGTPGTSFGAHRWHRGLAVLNQHIFRVDFNRNAIDPDWMVFAINEQLSHLIDKAHGAVGLSHVTRRECDGMKIWLPDVTIQRRIARRLKEQMAAVEQARQLTADQVKSQAAMPERYLQSVFSSAEAAEWPRHAVGDAFEFLPARSINLKGTAAVRAVTTACLTETGFTEIGVKDALMVSGDVVDAVIQPGEVLIARSNTPALVGRAAVFEGSRDRLVASDLTIRLRCRHQLVPGFAGAWFSYLFTTGFWRERASGGSDTMKKIGRAQLAATEIPIPSVTVQERIAVQLREQFTSLRQLNSALSAQLDAIESLPGAYLREAFSEFA